MSRIDEIKARLDSEVKYNGKDSEDRIRAIGIQLNKQFDKHFSTLAAHAQTDLAYLLSEIERLENEIPKWIKCSDGLPEYLQEVLVWASRIDNPRIGSVIVMNFLCHSVLPWADISLRSSECFENSYGYEETETYIKNTDGRFFDVSAPTQQEITHWMPLPEPPKEEQP